MESVMRGLTNEACPENLDVIVIGLTFQEQHDNLRNVFQGFRGPRLKLNSEKWQLFQKEMQYLGYRTPGVTTDPEKLKAVQRCPPPRNKNEQRGFLGLCTDNRKFIGVFASIAKPLIKLTEEKRTYQWPPGADAAFRSLKESLCTAPILGYPAG
jgi:hypothetical protein